MKKINLDLANLRVESFETTASAADLRGTIRAASITDEDCETQYLSYCPSCGDTQCLDATCGSPCEPTFPYSCDGSCVGDTCNAPSCGLFTC